MNKKLSNEVLPAPVIASRQEGARERVIRKMRVALAAGATTLAFHACSTQPFGVVDPLPPPAHCADMGGPAAQVEVTAGLDPGAPTRRFRITVKQKADSGLNFGLDASATGGTVLQQTITGAEATFVIIPDANATELVITLPATCNDFRNGATDSLLVITVSPVSSDTPSVSVKDLPAPDAGFDGGDDGGSDAGASDGGDGGP